MRWKKRIPKPKIKRCVGEERIRYHFAIFPVLIDKEWVWLERYKTTLVWSPNDPLSISEGFQWHIGNTETINSLR